MIKGICLCGQITVTTDETSVLGVIRCFCNQCYSHLGNYAPWAVCDVASTTIEGTIKTYQSSEKVERLNCATCGAVIGKRTQGGVKIMISAGLFPQDTKLDVIKDIFIDSKREF